MAVNGNQDTMKKIQDIPCRGLEMTFLCDGGSLGTGKTVVGEDCVVLTLL